MSAPEQMTNCPSAETLAAFIEGRLDGPARRRVIEHMSACADCRSIYLDATELAAHAPASELESRKRSNRVAIGVIPGLAAAAALFVVFLTPIREWVAGSRSGIPALVKATSALPERSIEGRLTGGFPYKIYRNLRSADRRGLDGEINDVNLLLAASKIEERAEQTKSSDVRHALATAQLLRKRPNEAIETLEELLRDSTGETDIATAIRESADAALLTDLAAAYLARNRSEEDAASAGDAAERAWALARSPEAAWNRALAREALRSDQGAIAAWRDYLKIDDKSEWAAEARRNLQYLEAVPQGDWNGDKRQLYLAARDRNGAEVRRLVKVHAAAARVYCERDLLLAWANDPNESDEALQVVAMIGAAVQETTGDELIVDLASAISTAVRRGQGARVRTSLRELAAARVASLERRFDEAEALLTGAAATLAAVGAPLAAEAEIEKATLLFNQNEYASALKQLEIPAGQRVYSSHAARRGWISGLCLMQVGRPYEALASYRQALAAAQQINDHGLLAGLEALTARSLSILGDREEAWRHRVLGFDAASRSASPERLNYVITEAFVAAVQERRAGLAEFFGKSFIKPAPDAMIGPLTVGTYVWRARLNAQVGRTVAAMEDCETARGLVPRLKDAGSRDRAAATIDLAEGVLQSDVDPRRAIVSLTDALRFYRTTGEQLELVQLYARRAAAYERLGQNDLAHHDYEQGLSEIERQRTRIADPVQRASFLQAAQEIFERRVRFDLNRGDHEAAFATAERARARTLLDRTGPSALTPTTAARVRASLPMRTALIEYFFIGDRLGIWVLKRDEVSYREAGVDRRTISALVDAIVERAAGSQTLQGIQRECRLLNEYLIAPVAAKLESLDTLVVVPDGDIQRVPFAGLCSSAGRFLVEDFEIRVFTSASLLEHAAAPLAPQRDVSHATVFFNNGGMSGVGRLRSPASEARRIVLRLRQVTVVDGEKATREAFMNALGTSDILHFAGHAFVNTEEPDYSALVVSTGSGGLVYSHDIRTMRLTRPRLVVLAACDTAQRRSASRDGNASLVQAFLAAGVPEVVGSLWPAEDGSAADFMDLFYESLGRGETPASALRTAQLASLRAPGGSMEWMAFELWGGARG